MSLIPWRSKENKLSPIGDWESVHDQLNRFLNQPLLRLSDFSSDTWQGTWAPAIDVVDNKNEYKIQADIPGLNKDDLDIAIENDVLTIRGEKKTETETKEEGILRKERSYGSFYRSFNLPQSVDANKVKASYKNGVLELHVPKKPEAAPKKVNIDLD